MSPMKTARFFYVVINAGLGADILHVKCPTQEDLGQNCTCAERQWGHKGLSPCWTPVWQITGIPQQARRSDPCQYYHTHLPTSELKACTAAQELQREVLLKAFVSLEHKLPSRLRLTACHVKTVVLSISWTRGHVRLGFAYNLVQNAIGHNEYQSLNCNRWSQSLSCDVARRPPHMQPLQIAREASRRALDRQMTNLPVHCIQKLVRAQASRLRQNPPGRQE